MIAHKYVVSYHTFKEHSGKEDQRDNYGLDTLCMIAHKYVVTIVNVHQVWYG